MKIFNTYTLSKGNAKEVIEKALKNLAWDYEKTDFGYKIVFGMDLKTWGSVMDIMLVNETKFNISVKSKLPTQITDSGDGYNKVEKLITAVQRLEG